VSSLPTAIIVRLLGPEAATGGPFALLGVPPNACTPQAIEDALQRQLDRISRHPEGHTLEADRLQVVLHEAALALGDPSRRAVLAGRFGGPAAGPTSDDDAGPAVEVGGGADLLSAKNVARAAAHELEQRMSESVAGPTLFRVEPERTGIPIGLIVGVSLGAVAVLAAVLVLAFSFGAPRARPAPATANAPTSTPGAGAAPVKPAPSQVAGVAPEKGSTGPAVAKAGRSAFVEPVVLIAGLRGARSTLAKDASAGEAAMTQNVRVLADWWARLTDGQRRAADDAIVEFLFAAPPERARAVLAEIGRGASALAAPAASVPRAPSAELDPDAVWPAVWSAGMLNRLLRERELAAVVDDEARGRLLAALGAARLPTDRSFESGASAGLAAASGRLAMSPALASERWLEAAKALARGDETAVESSIVAALDAMIGTDEDVASTGPGFKAVQTLAAAARWRSEGPGRAAVVQWFRDDRVSSLELHALTQALAGSSGAEGVEQTMVLSPDATKDQRLTLRTQYLGAWNLAEAGGRLKALGLWREFAGQALSRQETAAEKTPRDPEALLRSSVELARTSEAARRLWRGDDDAAQAVLAATEQIVSDATPPAGAATALAPAFPPVPGDGAWAERFLQAEQRIPARLERLAEAASLSRPIGPIDAAVLVDAAILSSPIQVRFSAQRAARTFVDDPALVAALLDALPRAPRIVSVSDLIQRVGLTRLPPVTDPTWELAARRSLVERLLSLLAAEGVLGRTESLVRALSETYQRAAEMEPGTGAGASATGAIEGVRKLCELVHAEARGSSGEGASDPTWERRRRGRVSLAEGPVQVFAAEQTALAELLASVVVRERPRERDVVESVLRTLSAERRSATHVFEQIAATEAAIVRLWTLRLGEASS
jgi:hypothetical protein